MNLPTEQLLILSSILMAIATILIAWGLAGVVGFLKNLYIGTAIQIHTQKKIRAEQEYAENRELKMLNEVRKTLKEVRKVEQMIARNDKPRRSN